MVVALSALVAALVFAVAGYGGARLGEHLCAGREPYDDGPAPVAVGATVFALAAGVIGAAIGFRGGESPLQLALLLLAVGALAGCSAADFRCGILPDALTLVPLCAVVAAGALGANAMPALGAAFVAVPFAAAAALSRGRGMGWGDVKLAALGGALLGAGGATLAFVAAALAAIVATRLHGAARRPIAYGPYLAASIAVSLTFTRTI